MSNLNEQITYTGVIATAGAAATLTDDETDNTLTLHAKYLSKLHLGITYTPATAQTNRYLMIAIDISNDGGTTYRRITTKANTTTEILVYEGAGGVWGVFPGNKTSTGATAYTGEFDMEILGGLVRISVKESSTGNYGTALVDVTLAS